MTISAYCGVPGAGKSYSVVKKVILPALKDNRTIYTNIPLNDDLLIEEFGHAPTQITIAEILSDNDYWVNNIENGAVVVIDEVAKLWKSGLKAVNARPCDATFLQEHRHLTADGRATEIILCCQDIAQISSFVKLLIDRTFLMYKLNSIGQSTRFRVDMYDLAQSQTKLVKSQFVSQEFDKYEQAIWKYYSSHTLGDGAGDETVTDTSFKLLKRWQVVVGAIILVCLVTFCVWGINYFRTQVDSAGAVVESEKTETEKSSEVLVSDMLSVFLDRFDDVHIISNNMILGYVFKASLGDGKYVTLKVTDLLAFDVVPFAISECLVVLRDIDNNPFDVVGCESSQDSGDSFTPDLDAS